LLHVLEFLKLRVVKSAVQNYLQINNRSAAFSVTTGKQIIEFKR
jgi:hypothetical protein